MVRLPRKFSRVAVACSLALPLTALSLPAWAQDPGTAAPAAPTAPAPTPAPDAQPASPTVPAPDAQPAAPGAPAAPAAPAADKELDNAVANYWHYGKIARYDLQAAEGEKILAKSSDPVAVMHAFDRFLASTEVNGRRDNYEHYMLKWQGIEQVADVTNKINAVVNQGRAAFRADPAFIDKQIQRLNEGTARGRAAAILQLRNSGELAVPIMIDYLRDPARRQFHPGVRQALRELGQSALSPLVAATEMTGANNQEPLVAVVTALGEIGYDDVVPYLARVANDQNAPGAARAAAAQALARMGAGNAAEINASNQFYDLAEKFYYDNASITSGVRDPQTPANVWYWDNQRGLIRRQVPNSIFNEVMALRAAEYALKLGTSQDALSLWVASDYKRESELPEGATDPTRPENHPPAHYWGVTSGVQYMNSALARALRDRNSAVALRAIRGLQATVGNANLFHGEAGGALADAMTSPDRLVRYEAAFAIAAARPRQQFQGQDRVVPLLAEALGQTGTPSVLVIGADAAQTNKMIEGLKGAGYSVAGGAGADAGITASAQLPSVDVILVSEDIGGADVDRLFAAAGQNPRLSGASRIVITKTAGSPFASRAVTDRMLSVTQVTDPAALKPVIDQARAKGASLPLDAEAANSYATRAGQLLSDLAISGGSVLDLTAAEQALLGALNDPRPDIAKSAAAVLSKLDLKTAQPALLAAASAEKPDDVRIAQYKSLAGHAGSFGRQIEGEQVATLDKAVVDEKNLDVRAAAAEARGAMNLPAEQAKTLIINQSVGTGAPAKPGEAPAAAQ